ncbi:MAG: hypothetical protein J5756_03705 [Clostridia bacterium]|nr:hypothetical protein [Clostridia bacterium]MBR5769444.1 hypothetical protein [Clostridia bacterium]
MKAFLKILSLILMNYLLVAIGAALHFLGAGVWILLLVGLLALAYINFRFSEKLSVLIFLFLNLLLSNTIAIQLSYLLYNKTNGIIEDPEGDLLALIALSVGVIITLTLFGMACYIKSKKLK